MEVETAVLSRVESKPEELRAALVAAAEGLAWPAEPPPALRRYATAYLAALLATGKPRAAHPAAAQALTIRRFARNEATQDVLVLAPVASGDARPPTDAPLTRLWRFLRRGR